jgi:hypothetical protein
VSGRHYREAGQKMGFILEADVENIVGRPSRHQNPVEPSALELVVKAKSPQMSCCFFR